jgi:hypothetical protein
MAQSAKHLIPAPEWGGMAVEFPRLFRRIARAARDPGGDLPTKDCAVVAAHLYYAAKDLDALSHNALAASVARELVRLAEVLERGEIDVAASSAA